MSMFEGIELEETLESKDVVGGSYAKFDKTGYGKCVIEKAYAGTSSGGAFSVTIHLKREDGAKLTVTEYISSGTAKGCKNYYLDRNGNKQYLPGYNKIKNLDALLGFSRAYPATSKGNVMLWDRDLAKEIPQEKEVISEWIGKDVGVLGQVVLEDKYNDEYNVRERYEIQHFLDPKTDKTRNETVTGDSGFKDKWLKAYPEDFVVDKRKLSKTANPSGSTPNIDISEDEEPF